MKTAATLFLLVLASCATPSDPGTSVTEENAVIVRVLPAVNTTCQWVPGKTCYGLANDGNNIWPTGMGITSVQVLTRSGPTRLSGSQQTFLAFVIWNNTTVGRIFRVDIGSDGANWRDVLSNVTATRTFNNLDFNTGSTGTASGGPVNPPHPNVEGPITFESTYLGAVTGFAGAIDDAGRGFLGTKSAAIDQ
jgi:hypothetical protein